MRPARTLPALLANFALACAAAPAPTAVPSPPPPPGPIPCVAAKAAPTTPPAPVPAPPPLYPRPATRDPLTGRFSCKAIEGPSSVVLSFDGGRTLVQSPTPRSDGPDGERVMGLVSLGKPFTLAALIEHPRSGGQELFSSTDGGCHWASLGTTGARWIGEGHDGLTYAAGSSVYAVTAQGVRALPSPPARSVEVDGKDKRHLRAVTIDTIIDSVDGGATWTKVSSLPVYGDKDVIFASRDLDHALLRDYRWQSATRVSRDGGRSWAVSTGGPAMLDTLWFAPDGKVAWSFGATLQRSTDGGKTFGKVVQIAQPNGWGATRVVLLGAQPDPNVFVFAVAEVETYSRFLLRIDKRSLNWTKQTLPMDPGHYVEMAISGSEVVTAGTFVPGEDGVMCLERRPC